MTSTFSIGGLVSGIDANDLVRQLMNLERLPVRQLEQRQSALRKAEEAWGTITTRISALRTAVNGIRTSADWNRMRAVTSSNPDAVAVSVTAAPTSGSVAFTIDQLAAARQRASGDTFANLGASMEGRSLTFDFADGSEPLTVTGSADTTLSDFVQQINNANAPVRAQAVKVTDGEYRLVLTARSTGTANDFTLTDTTGWANPFQSAQGAQDAQLTIGSGDDPLVITRSSNTITDFIDGVRLELRGTTTGPVTVTTAQDVDGAVAAVKKFVDEINAVLASVRQQSRVDPSGANNGPLQGDPLTRRIIQDLVSAVSSTAGSGAGLGLSITREGTVSLDTTALRAALEADFDSVARAFSRSASATDLRVGFVAASDQTQPGAYGVTITQAAEVAAKTGVNYNPPLGPRTLTIQIAGKTIDVDLEGDESLQQVVEAINTALAEQNVTSLQASDSGGAVRLATTNFGSSASFTVDTSGGDDWYGLDGTHTGVDVAGTVGGEVAVGSGRTLTVNEGAAKGLVIRVTASPADVAGAGGSLDLGEVTYSRGIAGRVSSALANLEGITGAITRSRDSVKDQIKLFQDRIDRFEVRLEQRERTLLRQFTAMETALSALTQQGNWIASQLAGLNNNRL